MDIDTAQVLRVTSNHLLWSVDRNEWTRVDSLAVGKSVQTADGIGHVTRVRPLEGWQVVYDLEVYRDHNYYVGDLSLLAHNACPLDILDLKKAGKMDEFYAALKKFDFGYYLEKTLGWQSRSV